MPLEQQAIEFQSFSPDQIWPIEGTKADSWPPIKYGEVPPGFYQKIPQSGNAPPLQEGKMYEAGGPASNANGGSIWFKIENGKSVEIPKPGAIEHGSNYPLG